VFHKAEKGAVFLEEVLNGIVLTREYEKLKD
jgi:hypothetical protein